MAQQLVEIRGQQIETHIPEIPDAVADFLKVERYDTFDLSVTRDATAKAATFPADDDDVLIVELQDGTRLWMTLAEYRVDFGTGTAPGRGAPAARPGAASPPIVIDGRLNYLGGQADRGLGGWVARTVTLIRAHTTRRVAELFAAWIDARIGAEGLMRCPLDGNAPVLQPLGTLDADAPWLVFIHGTMSSTRGSFSGLWAPAQREALRRLRAAYPERSLAYEHKTFTASPIDNALTLAASLPSGARLHLVTHSRGGLIGELLCRAQRCDARGDALDPFDDVDLGLFDAEGFAEQRAQLRKLSALLRSKRLRIERFVRVACPASGTALLSTRVDRLLSVLSRGFSSLGPNLAGGLTWFLAAVVKERTDPRVWPGIEAMIPDSSLTRMLNRADVQVAADLRVIAGDYAASSAAGWLADWASEGFFAGPNDIVVNTPSMFTGARRRDCALAWSSRVSGGDVWHLSYFERVRSVELLTAGLLADHAAEAGYEVLGAACRGGEEETRGAALDLLGSWHRSALVQGQPSTRGSRPFLVLVPGVMGSELWSAPQGDDPERLWVNAFALAGGAMGRLALPEGDRIEAEAVLALSYARIAEYLGDSHEVLSFPYDWRRSMQGEGERLATWLGTVVEQGEKQARPVRILAHSMGGLLVRAAIAAGHRAGQRDPDADWWRRMQALDGARLIMAGTPTRGSWLVPYALTGREPLIRAVAAVDLCHDRAEIAAIVGSFPGFLELAPEDAGRDWLDPATWASVHAADTAPPIVWQPPRSADLATAKGARTALDGAEIPPGVFRYIAGSAPSTPSGLRLDDGFEFQFTAEGDGRVTWADGIPDGVDTYYVDAAHGDLLDTQGAFPGICELLQVGHTDQLSRTRPAGRGAPPRSRDDRLPYFPDQAMLARAALGGVLWSRDAETDAATRVPLTVSVVHGDLLSARHPVMVGHYDGDTITSAEAVIDRRLDGQLSRRLAVGIYPARIGESEVFFGDRHTKAGIVVGLGDVGGLSPGELRHSVARAVLRYATQRSEVQDGATAGGDARRELSTLLIGSNAGGIPVKECVRAIVEGVRAANATLVEQGHGAKPIGALEFVEIYQDRALQALRALRDIALADPAAAAGYERALRLGRGGRVRASCDETPGWWRRIKVVMTPDHALEFTALTDRARAPVSVEAMQRTLVDEMIQQASMRSDVDVKQMRALFELLVPNDLKARAGEQDDLQLILDDAAAAYPWEMMYAIDGGKQRPLALHAGLLRQLSTRTYRPRPESSGAFRALVVGAPQPNSPRDCRFDPLPGVWQECDAVVAMLASGLDEVVPVVDRPATEVMAHLFDGEYRVLHLAGHGVYRFPVAQGGCCTRQVEEVSGMVIGCQRPEDGAEPRPLLLGPGEIAKMTRVPDLVFINCCHLGAMARDHNRLAANLATQFIRIGVRAVIAAGWAVDDTAAETFARTFYAAMNRGEGFGNAVRIARRAAYEARPNSNTWAAYQCYGDPAFRFDHADRDLNAPIRPRPYLAPAEAENAVNAFAAAVRNAPAQAAAGGDRPHLDTMVGAIPLDWLAMGRLRAAVAAAYAGLGAFARAIEHYEAAVRCPDGGAALGDLDQLAQVRVRHAERDVAHTGRDAALATMDAAIDDMRGRAERLGAGTERAGLIAEACQRRLMRTPARDLKTRVDLLDAIQVWYRRGADLDGRVAIDPALRWAGAALLRALLDGHAARAIPDDLDAILEHLGAAIAGRHADHPGFQEHAQRFEWDLLRALRALTASGAPAAPPPAEIEARYAKAVAEEPTRCELDALTAQLRFLRSQLPGRKALHTLRDLLDRLLGEG